MERKTIHCFRCQVFKIDVFLTCILRNMEKVSTSLEANAFCKSPLRPFIYHLYKHPLTTVCQELCSLLRTNRKIYL